MAILRGSNTILLNSGSHVIAYKSTNQIIAMNDEIISFDTTERNILSAWNTSTSTFTCKVNGIYCIKANIYFNTGLSPTSVRFKILKNSNQIAASTPLDFNNTSGVLSLSVDTELVVNDEIQLSISGASIADSYLMGGISGFNSYIYISLYPS